jgi:hypothetical protein
VELEPELKALQVQIQGIVEKLNELSRSAVGVGVGA